MTKYLKNAFFLLIGVCSTILTIFIFQNQNFRITQNQNSVNLLLSENSSLLSINSQERIEYDPKDFTPTPSTTVTPKPTLVINQASIPLKIYNVSPLFTSANYLTFAITKSSCIGTFEPSNILLFNKNYSRGNIQLSGLIVNDLTNMITDAANSGIDLKVVSGYRSYSDQSYIFEKYVQNELTANPRLSRAQAEARANSYSAYPGCSEHQLGVAVDLLSNESNYTFAVNENMKFVKWIESNSPKYHFSISYPKANPEYKYEPWHLRWKP